MKSRGDFFGGFLSIDSKDTDMNTPPPLREQWQPCLLSVSTPNASLHKMNPNLSKPLPPPPNSATWSDSEATLEDYQPSENELWDSFWSDCNGSEQNPFLFVGKSRDASCEPERAISPHNLTFPSPKLSSITFCESTTPPCSPPRPASKRYARPSPRGKYASKSVPQNVYRPFPLIPAPQVIYHSSGSTNTENEKMQSSWPFRENPNGAIITRSPARVRAKTEPAIFTPLAHPTSDLSTCTTLDKHYPSCSSIGSDTPLFMHGSNSTSRSQSTCPLPLLEKSVFEDDDTDDEDESSGFVAQVASKLHIRSTSDNSLKAREREDVDTKNPKRTKRSAGAAFKYMFGMKK